LAKVLQKIFNIKVDTHAHPLESLLSGEHVVIIYCKKLKSLVHEMTLQYNCYRRIHFQVDSIVH
jgi:hypothetical protein